MGAVVVSTADSSCSFPVGFTVISPNCLTCAIAAGLKISHLLVAAKEFDCIENVRLLTMRANQNTTATEISTT